MIRLMWRKAKSVCLVGMGCLAIACGGSGQDGDVPTTAGTGGAGASSSTATGTGGTAGSGGSAATTGGPVSISGVFNARHTGGLLGADGRRVRDQALIRSGHLADLDTTGCDQLQALQIHSVIDLRAADGSTGATTNPDATCATTGPTYHLVDLPKILPPSEASYLQTLDALEPKLAAIFQVLGHQDGAPAILHCVIGRDRAGIAMALVLLAVGVPGNRVVTDFVTNQDASVQADVQPEWLEAVVARVDAQGGIDAYLQQHNVPPAQITALKQIVLE